MRSILAVLFVALYLILGSIWLGILWIYGKSHKEKADLLALRFVQWAFRVVMFISGVKLEVKGAEKIPKDEPVLYIGNHRGIFDVVATYTICPDRTGYIAKDSIKKVPILGMFMKRLYCLFIQRDDIKQSLKVILAAIDQVKNGISICIFPEGTRNKDADPKSVMEFKEGSFKIAQKTGCKIVPMAITGTADIFENHFPWIKKGTVTITYGDPIVLSELSKEDQKRIGAYTRDIIISML